jgi:threonine/homoserine/homoserine lactone efflux protein
MVKCYLEWKGVLKGMFAQGMVNVDFFLRGLLIGFSVAIPVGPIAILCMRRTLVDGQVSGLVSGLGAATADAIYGLVAGFGLNLFLEFLVSYQTALRLIGGCFLIYLGIRTLRARHAERPIKVDGRGLLGAYASTLLLTLTNPLTILVFGALFAGLGLVVQNGDMGLTAALILGLFLGSALWWLVLSLLVGQFREKVSRQAILWVNRASGVVICCFGLFALLSVR